MIQRVLQRAARIVQQTTMTTAVLTENWQHRRAAPLDLVILDDIFPPSAVSISDRRIQYLPTGVPTKQGLLDWNCNAPDQRIAPPYASHCGI